LKAAFLISPDIPLLGKVPVNVLALVGYGILSLGLAVGAASASLALGLGFLGVGVETALVLGLAGNARFQKYVDAQRSKELRQARQGNAASPEELVQQMLHALPKPLANRFDALRRRCLELRSLAQDLRDPDHLGPPLGLEELQLAGLDR